ncbi:MAG: hypothetical protein A3F83_16875 [Candidatus Glassbacteria bacterium RIFCSPLOWO2_12_FULL_58_11]|uniref:Uncharacterized protein n=1 Tax=Candidatus Glassbacteria bacterium RIFCSPLOWO2_12_FULL_58_11 TaxID=1817867 RepID=A0A1F5YM21_9BACT|nr:MAG: hypothetical protein A3F83_16875 [Candidatus Glassbacteria bacterium RIFCSPLOWO2_12_FULL_58_11]
MKKSDYFLKSLVNAAGVMLYTSAVAWLMFHGQQVFGRPANFLMPLFILLLLIISASITGLLVFGKPILLYLDGLKKEAFTLLFATLAWLIFFAILIISILVLQ